MKQSWTFEGCVTLHLYKEDGALPSGWENLASDEEHARAAKMGSPQRADTFLRTRALLRQELGALLNAAPASLDIQCTPEGRPFLAQSPIDFSLSHSHGFILIGITKNGRTGVDLQYQDPETPIEKLVGRLSSDGEKDRIESIADNTERRAQAFRLWCEKEARFKLGRDYTPQKIMTDVLDNHFAYAVCYAKT